MKLIQLRFHEKSVFLGPTGFVVTGSIDGHVKFWKKREVGIEFVKHFRAHLASIRHMTMNSTGTIMITISEVRKYHRN